MYDLYHNFEQVKVLSIRYTRRLSGIAFVGSSPELNHSCNTRSRTGCDKDWRMLWTLVVQNEVLTVTRFEIRAERRLSECWNLRLDVVLLRSFTVMTQIFFNVPLHSAD